MSERPAGDRDEIHITKGCFGCGTENVAGLRLRPYREGDGVAAEFEPQPHHRGFTSAVHGGIISAVLDEIIASAVGVKLGGLMATVGIEVRFSSPMLLGVKYRVCARYVGLDGTLHTAEGEITDEAGRLIASARGRFVPLTQGRKEKFLGATAKSGGAGAGTPE